MTPTNRIAKIYVKGRLDEQPSDFAYWQTQSYEIRLATLEQIRQEYHAWKDGAEMQQIELNQDFKDFIQALNENNVRYLVIGAYALAFHGHPRYTKDIDIWLWMDDKNATNALKAIAQFGFASLGLSADDFLEPDTFIQLGFPPNRIDLIIGLKGMNFERCYTSKIEVEFEDVTVNFIDLENLKKTKRIAGRLQDLADLEKLE